MTLQEREQLVIDYQPLVKGHLQKNPIYLTNLGFDAEDIYQEGLVALIKAAAKFEPTKGKFAAYAKRVIANHYKDLIKANQRRIESFPVDFSRRTEVEEEPPKKKANGGSWNHHAQE